MASHVSPGAAKAIAAEMERRQRAGGLMSEMERMRDRVLQLEQILGIDSSETGRIREAFGLEPDLARIMGMLLKRNFVSHESLYTVMYGHRPECEWPDAKVLDVQICKLRRRLKPHDVTIATRWGEGWSISVPNKVKARAVLDPAAAATAAVDTRRRRMAFLEGA
jgi:DNA-binding response OmpR family regulator